MKSIVEQVLNINDIPTKVYLSNTIDLVKSIVFKYDLEARLYNDLVYSKYNLSINPNDKTTWRYYRHLSNQLLTPIDNVITIRSIDNNQNIVLNRSNMNIHTRTRKELLKFGDFYKFLVNDYKEQELYIKTSIVDHLFNNIHDLINKDDFSIVGVNLSLIEDHEKDIIFELEDILKKYSEIWLIGNYVLSDSLFLAAQYSILSHFLFLSVLGLRLKYAKTGKVDTYHLRNYLGSFYFMDRYIHMFKRKTHLYLQRNIRYLNNFSGFEKIFKDLINNLFSEYNISMVNYRYEQINTHSNYKTDYQFRQKLLNDGNFYFYNLPLSLSDIKVKEKAVLKGNEDEWNLNEKYIDDRLRLSLHNKLLTKDIESIYLSNIDANRYKLLDTIHNYWMYLINLSLIENNTRIDFIVSIDDPVTNQTYTFNQLDLFKFYVIILHAYHGIRLVSFPDFNIYGVWNDKDLKDFINIVNTYFTERGVRSKNWYLDILNDIRIALPDAYNIYIGNSSDFYNLIRNIYKFNMCVWHFLSNLDDIDNSGNFELFINIYMRLLSDPYHVLLSSLYSQGESVDDFLTRFNIPLGIFNFKREDLLSLMLQVIRGIYGDDFDVLSRANILQKYLVQVFEKFKSYTTLILRSIFLGDPVLSGLKDLRYRTNESYVVSSIFYDHYNLNVDHFSMLNVIGSTTSHYYELNYDMNAGYSYDSYIPLNVFYNAFSSMMYSYTYSNRYVSNISIILPSLFLNHIDPDVYIATPLDPDHLDFLFEYFNS